MRRTMLTVFVLATSLCAVALLGDGAADPGATAETSARNAQLDFRQLGRFQMVQGHAEEMFLIDTMTGNVYRRTLGNGWDFDGNPMEIVSQRAKELAAQQREQAAKDRAAERERKREQAENAKDGKGKLTLDLPRDVVHMTIDQRTTKLMPGSQDRILVHIGDITEGRVRVTAISTNGSMLIEPTLMSPKQIVRFQVGDEKVYLQLLELKNAFLGTDVAEIEISKDLQLLTGEEGKESKEAPREDR